MPRPVALLDVDHTLILARDFRDLPLLNPSKPGDYINQPLLDALKAKGILDAYLFTDMTLNPEAIKERLMLIDLMHAQGFTVHGVMTPNDLIWNVPGGTDPAKAVALHDQLEDPSSTFNKSAAEAKLIIMAFPPNAEELSALRQSYALYHNGLHYIESDGTPKSIPVDVAQFQRNVYKEMRSKGLEKPENLSPKVIKKLITINWGYLQSWIAGSEAEGGPPRHPGMRAVASYGYHPLEQTPGAAFAEAAEQIGTTELQTGIAARSRFAKLYGDELATPHYRHAKGLMLDLFLSHQPNWVSSIIVIDDHPKVVETIRTFRPISFHSTQSYARLGMLPIDKIEKPNQLQYERLLHAHLAEDPVMQIHAEIGAHIATLSEKMSAFSRSPQPKIEALQNLKQYLMGPGEPGYKTFAQMYESWGRVGPLHLTALAQHRNIFAKEARPETPTSSQIFLAGLLDTYGTIPLDRMLPPSRPREYNHPGFIAFLDLIKEMFTAPEGQRTRQIKEILAKNPEWADMPDSLGAPALFYAIQNKDEAIVRILLQHGADPSKTVYGDGMNALHLASRGGASDLMIQALLEHGASLTTQSACASETRVTPCLYTPTTAVFNKDGEPGVSTEPHSGAGGP